MKQRGVQTDPHVYSHSIYNTDATGERVVKKKITIGYPFLKRENKESRPLSHTINKNQLQMDYRSNCKR